MPKKPAMQIKGLQDKSPWQWNIRGLKLPKVRNKSAWMSFFIIKANQTKTSVFESTTCQTAGMPGLKLTGILSRAFMSLPAKIKASPLKPTCQRMYSPVITNSALAPALLIIGSKCPSRLRYLSRPRKGSQKSPKVSA